MPTYEYACKDCGDHFEIVQSFRDNALTECPACDGSLRKVFSAAGIIFKGSGWHVKDYADTSNGAANGKASADTSSETSSSSGDGAAADAPSGSKDTSTSSSGTSEPTAKSA